MDNGASSYRRFLDGDDKGLAEIVRDYRDDLILYLNGIVNSICTAANAGTDKHMPNKQSKQDAVSPRFINLLLECFDDLTTALHIDQKLLVRLLDKRL